MHAWIWRNADERNDPIPQTQTTRSISHAFFHVTLNCLLSKTARKYRLSSLEFVTEKFIHHGVKVNRKGVMHAFRS